MLQWTLRIGAVSLLLMVAAGDRTDGTEIWEFTGTSCGACRQMEPLVAELRASGIPVRRVDVQQDARLAQSMGVQYIPCFVVVVDGQAVDRITGATTKEQLIALYQRVADQVPSHRVIRGQSRPGRGLPRETVEAAATMVSQPPPAATASSSIATTEQRALAATVRLRVVDPQGQSYGTGTIIHARGGEALVLTCGHIFRDSGGKGQIVCDLFVNGRPSEVRAGLVAFDLRRDVGLVSLQPGGSVTAVPVGGTGSRQQPGDAVFAIGCSHGGQPTVNRNSILDVNRYHGPANLVVGGRPVDGRSGGGLFDESGTLIGICNAADQQADEGLYAALGPIHAQLDDCGLGFVYRDQVSAPILDFPAMAHNQTVSATPSAVATDALHSTQTDQSTEVIVILRQTGNTGRDGQAYVLDHPSSRLLQVLSGELSQRGAHEMTGLHVPASRPSLQPGLGAASVNWSPLDRR